MWFSQFNPFIYGQNNTPNIGSSVLRMLVNVCPPKNLALSPSNVTHYAGIPGNVSLSLATKDLADLISMNITPNGSIGMIYHTFIVPEIPKSVEITLKPSIENETFDLYIRKRKMADLKNYNWQVTLPSNASSDSDTYTFFIPAGNLTPGLLFIGIRKTPGKSGQGRIIQKTV